MKIYHYSFQRSRKNSMTQWQNYEPINQFNRLACQKRNATN